MGRNFWSVCHQCEVKMMHFRWQEGDLMQQFQKEHNKHEKMTEIFNDYIEEPPERYEDLDNPTYKPAHPKGEHKLKTSGTKTCEFCGALYVGSFKPKHLCNQPPTPSSVTSEKQL